MPTRLQIATSVLENLDDLGVTFYSQDDVNDSIQDGYNLYAALTGGIIKGTYIPKQQTPYWNLGSIVSDYMYLVGIYDWVRNRWLMPISIRNLDSYRHDWELWTGELSHFTVIDFRRVACIPYSSTASGTVFLLYKSLPPTLSNGIVPKIPKEVDDLLENYATADLLEQGREYQKAISYWQEWRKGIQTARGIITSQAQSDRLNVFQPYFPMGYYTSEGETDMHVDNEVPSGTINSVNTTFTLASAPNPQNSLLLMKNGQVLFEGVGYTLSGNTIIMAQAPDGPSEEDPNGDLLRAFYRLS